MIKYIVTTIIAILCQWPFASFGMRNTSPVLQNDSLNRPVYKNERLNRAIDDVIQQLESFYESAINNEASDKNFREQLLGLQRRIFEEAEELDTEELSRIFEYIDGYGHKIVERLDASFQKLINEAQAEIDSLKKEKEQLEQMGLEEEVSPTDVQQ